MFKKVAYSPAHPARVGTRAFPVAGRGDENEASPDCSWRFVAQSRRRVARGARGAV